MAPNVIKNGLNFIMRHFNLPLMGFKINWKQFQGYIMEPNVI